MKRCSLCGAAGSEVGPVSEYSLERLDPGPDVATDAHVVLCEECAVNLGRALRTLAGRGADVVSADVDAIDTVGDRFADRARDGRGLVGLSLAQVAWLRQGDAG